MELSQQPCIYTAFCHGSWLSKLTYCYYIFKNNFLKKLNNLKIIFILYFKKKFNIIFKIIS